MANKEQGKADVLQGTLDLMLLQTLATLGPLLDAWGVSYDPGMVVGDLTQPQPVDDLPDHPAGVPPLSPEDTRLLMVKAREAKENLTLHPSTTVNASILPARSKAASSASTS